MADPIDESIDSDKNEFLLNESFEATEDKSVKSTEDWSAEALKAFDERKLDSDPICEEPERESEPDFWIEFGRQIESDAPSDSDSESESDPLSDSCCDKASSLSELSLGIRLDLLVFSGVRSIRFESEMLF